MEQALRASQARSSHITSTAADAQRHYHGNIVDSIPIQDKESSINNSTSKATSMSTMSPPPPASTVPFASSSSLDKPVGLSFPAMLKQNVPGFKARSRIAQSTSRAKPGEENKDSARRHGEKAAQKLGKRKQRRWENAHFHGSIYITQPRSSDYHPIPLSSNPTFPSPPPSTFFPYKPSGDSTDPNARLPPTFNDMVVSADHGRFSLPIKGLKRNTRRIVAEGGIGSQIVEAVDAELRAWLDGTNVWMMHEQGGESSNTTGNMTMPIPSLNSGKRCICEVETDHGRVQAINQFAKQPHSLVWQSEDSFTRFLVHAIARYYRIVSFTKSDPSTSTHLIWLLRPNMAPRAGNSTTAAKPKSGFETPPTTASEWEASSIGGLTTSASEIDSNTAGSNSSGAEMLSSEEAESEGDYRLDEEGDETILALEEEDAVILSRAASPASSSFPSRNHTPGAVGAASPLSSAGAISRGHRQRRSAGMDRHSRPILGSRALSDIDSGAEVDDEKDEGDAFDDLDDLQDSITDLSLVDVSRTNMTASSSNDASRTSRWHPSSSSGVNANLNGHMGMNGTLGRRRAGDECSLSRDTSPVSYYRKAVAQQVRSSKTNQHGSASKGWRMPDRTFSEWVLAA